MGFADTPQPDDTGEEYDKKFTFRYFILANSIPIRVLVYPDNAGRVNAKDLWAMSQVLDKESGEFKQSQHLTKINWDDAGEYEEVSKEDFYQIFRRRDFIFLRKISGSLLV